MNKILNNDKSNIYKLKECLENKYLYFSKKLNDYTYHYIFTILDIIDNENIVTYKTKKCYIFSIPIQQNQKCYLYENYNEIDLDIHKDILYEMSFEEFVNTFRTFIKYDGFIANDIPSKIIQDNIY